MSPVQPMVLKPSPAKVLGQMLGAAVGVAGGIWVVGYCFGFATGWGFWVCAGVSALGLVAAGAGVVAILLPGRTRLEIGPDGATVRLHGRDTSFHWRDITHFEVIRMGYFRCVVFDYRVEYHRESLRKIPKAFAGHEGMIPGYFAIGVQELADLLSRFQREALSAPPDAHAG